MISNLRPKSSHLSRGYIALFGVLVVGAIGLAVTLSILTLGTSAGQTSFAKQQAEQAKALANACAEEALEQIREVTSYAGTNGLSLGQGTCTYIVTNTGGETRTVLSTGTIGTIVRKVQTTVSAINPQITLSSWQEI